MVGIGPTENESDRWYEEKTITIIAMMFMSFSIKKRLKHLLELVAISIKNTNWKRKVFGLWYLGSSNKPKAGL